MRIPQAYSSLHRTFRLLTESLLAAQTESIPSEYMYVSYSMELIPSQSILLLLPFSTAFEILPPYRFFYFKLSALACRVLTYFFIISGSASDAPVVFAE